MSTGDRAAVRVSTLALLVWQLLQGWRPGASQFELSYWLVTYEHGFVRRGLGGELLRLVPGPVSSELVHGAALAVSVLSALALVAVIITLLWRGDPPALWLALLLAASPFTVEVALNKHRPDQLGLVVLAALALAGGYRWVQLAASLLLGVFVLVHEGALVSYGLFALPLLVRKSDVRVWTRAAAFYVPSALATGLVLLRGRATPAQVDALLQAPAATAILERPTDTDYSVLPYLGDSMRDSVAVVASFPVEKAVLMVLWGALLAAAHAAWIQRADITASGPWIAWLPALAAFAFLHLTAVDWQRWMAAAFTSLLVVAAALLPHAPDTDAGPGRPAPIRVRIVWLGIAVAAYLASRTPAGSVGWRDGLPGFVGYWTWPF